MRTRFLVIAALAASITFTGCKSKDQIQAEQAAVKAELDKLQGKWVISSREGTDDNAEEGAPPPAYVITIKDDILEAAYNNDVIYRQKLKITPGGSPTVVDLIYVDENGKPMTTKKTKKSVVSKKKRSTTTELKDVGIYAFDGQKLKLAVSYDEKNRPKDFTAPPNSDRFVMVLEKIKDGSEKPTRADSEEGRPEKPRGPSSTASPASKR